MKLRILKSNSLVTHPISINELSIYLIHIKNRVPMKNEKAKITIDESIFLKMLIAQTYKLPN